jgi:hypothetical protein
MLALALTAACAALGALAAFAPSGDAAPASALVNTATYQDSTNEDSLAPDVNATTVANDDKGLLTFTVNIPNRPTLTGDMEIDIFVDSDANASTGDTQLLGADYILVLNALGGPAQAGLFRWNGTDFVTTGVPQTTLIFSYANGATLKINAAELGATKKFNFAVAAVSGIVITPTGDVDDSNSHFDLAPDPGHGFYAYEVKLAPPKLLVQTSGSRPGKPKAGKPYSVFVGLSRSDTGTAPTGGTVRCKASVGSAPVRAAGSLAGGRATCTVAVPKTAKGKTIRVSVTVSSGGLTTTRSFTAKVT